VVELGRIVSAPLQSAPIYPHQLFRLRLAELQRHVTLIGTTGSGKTTSLARLVDAALAAEWSVTVVDAKGGRLATVCRELGEIHRAPARIWLPGHAGSWSYDLCAGEPSAVGNRLIGAFEHGHEGQVYRNLSLAIVPLVVRALVETGQACTLDSLRESLDETRLSALARRTADTQLKNELLAMVNNPLHRATLSGIAGRLRGLRYGAFGPWLVPSERTLNLEDCLQSSGVTYLGLPATAASVDVALVGRLLIQHLKQVAYDALWSASPKPGLVLFDEFASLGDAEQLVDLLLQAREARLAVVVSTQQLPRDSAVLRKALLGAGVLMVHQVGAPEDADALARALGSRRGVEITRQITFGNPSVVVRRSLRGREEFLVRPDELARLEVGQTAVSVRFGQQRVAVVQVHGVGH
jgi:Type IV secretion-system coupling protein DNA-binding domain